MVPEIVCNALAHGVLFGDCGTARLLDFGGVLSRDENGVDRDRLVVFVHHAHLGFAVRQKVRKAAVVTDFS